MSTRTDNQEKQNILELVYHEGGKIRLFLSESQGRGPIAFYQEAEIALEKIDGLVREITHYLHRINVLKSLDQYLFRELQKSCHLLRDELLSREIKVRLQETPLRNLELIMDEQLVHIPWELLFDGQKFLCEQFSMGRQIRIRENKAGYGSRYGSRYDTRYDTRYNPRYDSRYDSRCGSGCGSRHDSDNPGLVQPEFPLNMLIIADPTEDLEVAWEEGMRIYDAFRQKEDMIRVTFHSGCQADSELIRKNLREYDLVHYAGHADYDADHPDQSCWMFSDGKLKAADIVKMTGSKRAMPGFIFANACQSGYTEKWLKEQETDLHAHQSSGLVHAFLMAGVRHYLGTFCEVSDEYSASMGLEFYYQLLQGKSMGESLRGARESFRQKFGTKSLCWINYVLYGHPADCLFNPGEKESERETAHKAREAVDKPGEAVDRLREPAHKACETAYKSKRSGALGPSEETGTSPANLRSGPAGAEPDLSPPPARHSQSSSLRQGKWIRAYMAFFLTLLFAFAAIFFSRQYPTNWPWWKEGRRVRADADNKARRIEELKKLIYEKLKARQEENSPQGALTSQGELTRGQGQAGGQSAGPLVIAVLSVFDAEAEHLPDWSIRTIKDLERKITQRFVETPLIKVAERKDMDKLLEEKDLELSDFSLSDQRELFGKFLYAKIMLFLNGYQSSEGISVCYKLVNGETGAIDKINSNIKLTRKERPDDLAIVIYQETRKVIDSQYLTAPATAGNPCLDGKKQGR
jgi:CHAT domain-containing protein